jgi:hypothetical protein
VSEGQSTPAGGARRLRLVAPPGYGRVVPLDRNRHGRLSLPGVRDYRWCDRLNAVFVNVVEFSRVALDYPIAFAREPDSGEFVPMAVLGLRKGENLFVDAGGLWLTGTYIPAYLRRYPFCIAHVPDQAGAATRHLVCVQEDGLESGGQPLFDPEGQPSEAWTAIEKLLEAVEGARQATRVLTKRLEAWELLVPFAALANPRKGPKMQLTGMYRVDEKKLGELSGANLRKLLSKGELRAVYAHLLSLERFARLMDLAVARHSGSAPAGT